MKYFMGIETSCDETGVAILDEKSKVLSNVLYSQAEIHEKFGLDAHAPSIDETIRI